MKVAVDFFKPSGKWYTRESVDVPDVAKFYDLDMKQFCRIKQMHVVFNEPNPWGFPLMITADRNV